MNRWQDPAPDEREAGERSWSVVREAFDERLPSPQRRDWRPVAAIALGAAILAAALTPPGHAVLDSIRDAVRGEQSRVELLSLPTEGRLLVNSSAGAWVVQRNGSKRLLGDYLDAVWSPHGLFVAAARGNELVALEPTGKIRWTVPNARPIGLPQWSFDGFRIAYLAGPSLRVVNGDSTGDRLIARRVNVIPIPSLAWRPGTHQLAYANNRGELVVLDVDRNRVVWRRPAPAGLERLVWSDDGTRLLAVSPRHLLMYSARGRLVWREDPSESTVASVAFMRGSHRFAEIRTDGVRSEVLITGPGGRPARTLFSGAGLFAGLAWSPDGRWLLVDWRSADQWVFIRSTAVRRIAVRNIGHTFDSGPEHFATLAGWCCP